MRIAILSMLLFAGVLMAAQVSTNLPATISGSYVTNVVSGDNSSGCNLCGPFSTHAVMGLPPCSPYKAPTEKWQITTILWRVVLTVMWNDRRLSHTQDEVMSSVTNRWKLESEWKQE